MEYHKFDMILSDSIKFKPFHFLSNLCLKSFYKHPLLISIYKVSLRTRCSLFTKDQPHQDSLVVSVSAFQVVGHVFVPQSGHTNDYH